MPPGELEPEPQDDTAATVCTKIRKSDGKINWSLSADDIEAMVRAYYPWPGASCTLLTTRGEMPVTLTRVLPRRDLGGAPGTVLQADKYALIVACGAGALEIVELSPPARRAMPAVAFLNGLRGEKTGHSALTASGPDSWNAAVKTTEEQFFEWTMVWKKRQADHSELRKTGAPLRSAQQRASRGVPDRAR
ncbi:MAG: hypothetical protein L6W00_13975 [Lentisphaeria bacterium]|nr:MAG: hypothetical protein L6W00_13975 [Lentisphaeria bacterium]